MSDTYECTVLRGKKNKQQTKTTEVGLLVMGRTSPSEKYIFGISDNLHQQQRHPQLGSAMPHPSCRIYKGRDQQWFFCPFSGWNPVILWYHLQKTSCEHGCCCSQLGKHTAVCGQNNRAPHSQPAMEADKCPSLQHRRSSFLIPRETVFLCLIALQLGLIKQQIRITWWWLGEEHFTSLRLLCAGRGFAELEGSCMPGAVPEQTVLPPQHSQTGIWLTLPQLTELLVLNILRQGPD